MMKVFVVVLLAISAGAGAAYARGGGAAEPMPQTSFTDLPSYHPFDPSQPLRRHARRHARWHHSPAHAD